MLLEDRFIKEFLYKNSGGKQFSLIPYSYKFNFYDYRAASNVGNSSLGVGVGSGIYFFGVVRGTLPVAKAATGNFINVMSNYRFPGNGQSLYQCLNFSNEVDDNYTGTKYLPFEFQNIFFETLGWSQVGAGPWWSIADLPSLEFMGYKCQLSQRQTIDNNL